MGTAEIATAIKSAREYRGLSQPQVADLLKVRYQTLSNWERGINRISADMLQRICSIYSISSEEVLKAEYWHDSYVEDFERARSDEELNTIILEIGHADPRIICQYCDFISRSGMQSAVRHVDLSPDEWDIIAAYRIANDDAQAIVDLALKPYIEKAARSEEQAG